MLLYHSWPSINSANPFKRTRKAGDTDKGVVRARERERERQRVMEKCKLKSGK